MILHFVSYERRPRNIGEGRPKPSYPSGLFKVKAMTSSVLGNINLSGQTFTWSKALSAYTRYDYSGEQWTHIGDAVCDNVGTATHMASSVPIRGFMGVHQKVSDQSYWLSLVLYFRYRAPGARVTSSYAAFHSSYYTTLDNKVITPSTMESPLRDDTAFTHAGTPPAGSLLYTWGGPAGGYDFRALSPSPASGTATVGR